MSEERERTGRGQVVAGIVVLGLGLALLLGQLDVVRFTDIGRLWPLIVIAIGASRLVGSQETESRRGGYTLVFLGCWFLIATLEVFGLDWGTSWPLALVAVGLAKVLAATTAAERSQGGVLLFIGAALQAVVMGVFGLSPEQAWPLVIIGIGLWIVSRAFGTGSRPGIKRRSDNEPS